MFLEKSRADYRIAIYVRESRDEDGENFETIETQRDLLIDFVSRNNLGNIHKIYMDDNVSGAGFEREGLKELKQDIENGFVNLVVIKDLSRLGRNNAQTLLFLDYLEEQGVRVISSDGRYDSEKDNETVGIETWYNERFLRDISRKVRANLLHKINRGEYLGSAPFGYKKSEKRKNHLCIDESTAYIVREIFELYKKGFGYSAISKILNDKGYPSPSSRNGVKGGKWNHVAVRRILCNRVYIGDTVQRVSEKISFKSKKTRRLPEKMWVITEKTHEPVIDSDTFYEVQKIRQGRKKGAGNHKGTLHVFKGLLYCGRCSKPLFARKRPNRPMGYICSNYLKNGSKNCTSHYVNEEKLIETIAGDLVCAYQKEDRKEVLLNLLSEEMGKGQENSAKIRQLRKNLENRIKQQDVLYMDKLEGNISSELFERTNSYLESVIKSLRKTIAELENTQSSKFIEAPEIFDDFIDSLKKGNLTYHMAQTLITKITVYDPGDILPEGVETGNSGTGLLHITYICKL